MPSPTWRTVPTSERSVSTSNCWIRSLRIEVISSGLSFMQLSPCVEARSSSASSGGCQFVSQALEPPADAAVGTMRPDLQDDPADELRVHRAGRFDRAAGRLLDRPNDRRRLLVGQRVGRRQLDREAILGLRNERVELGADLRQLAGATLLGDEANEVADELVALRR